MAKEYEICGIWDEADNDAGKRISSFIKVNLQQDVVRAELDGLSFLKYGTMYRYYFVVVSIKSMKDHKVMLYLTTVLLHLYKANLTKVLLIVIDSKIKEQHFPINLRVFDRVYAVPNITEDHVEEICQKFLEPLSTIIPTGNVGIGMAWNYFYGYLAIILPGMKDRILSSDQVKGNEKKISTKFIIIILDSCKTPETMTHADQRLSTVGPLDCGVQKSRAGRPSRVYKTFLHKIKNVKNEDDCYFCGEFATPLLVVRKMVECKIMDENEMEKQRVLFKHTLMAILNHERNPDCNDRAIIYDHADQEKDASLADELSHLIHAEGHQLQPIESGLIDFSSMSIIKGSDETALQWEKAICDFCAAADPEYGQTVDVDSDGLQHYSVWTYSSLEKLLNSDQETLKLLIILTESNKQEITNHADSLINHPIWFPKTTIIVDLPTIPKWLEESQVDYINTRKFEVGNFWNRLLGSLFGTAAVEGVKDGRWKYNDAGRQYQTDRLPIGGVACGLAWGYFLNYLDIIGPTIAQRVEREEHFKQGKMPKKLFILLPHSCYSSPTLAEDDPDITDAGKLKTHNEQIAGNFRNYDIAVHQILSANKTYYACVEYCTPVLVMYEMEAEGKAGLSQEQKEAQLLVFHKLLKDRLSNSEYKQHIKLICYDDYSPKKQRLSELLVENILMCL